MTVVSTPACKSRIAVVWREPVHGDAFVAERWAGVGGDGDVSGQPALDPVAGQRTPP